MSIHAKNVRVVNIDTGEQIEGVKGLSIVGRWSDEASDLLTDFPRHFEASMTFVHVDFDLMAVVCGYQDAVEMFIALEPHIVRGDN